MPAGMSVPSPTRQRSPSRAPGMRMAPLPTSHRWPTSAPSTTLRWPSTARSPTVTGCWGVPMMEAFSSTEEPAPSRTAPPWERTMAPWAMTAPGPRWIIPSTRALLATLKCAAPGRGLDGGLVSGWLITIVGATYASPRDLSTAPRPGGPIQSWTVRPAQLRPESGPFVHPPTGR